MRKQRKRELNNLSHSLPLHRAIGLLFSSPPTHRWLQDIGRWWSGAKSIRASLFIVFLFLVLVWNSSSECVSLSLGLSPPLSSCLYLSREDLGGYAVCHLACETDTKSFGCDLFELMVQNIVSTPHTQRQFRRCTGPIQMAHGIPPWSKHTCQTLTYSHEHAHAAPCKLYMQHMPKIHTFP